MAALKLPVTYLTQVEGFLSQQGIKTHGWLASKGLSKAELMSQSRSIGFRDYEHLILSAVNLDGRDDVGLRIGHYLQIQSHGALGFALMNCEGIEQVLDLFSRYVKTRTPLLDVDVSRGNPMLLSFHEHFDIAPIRIWFMEAVIVALSNIFRFISPDVSLLKRIRVPYGKPHYVHLYSQYIAHPLEFDHDKLVFEFNQGIGQLHFNGDPRVLQQAKALCDSEIKQFGLNENFSDRVGALLAQECTLTLEDISTRMHLTKRTLHRKLESENSSFHAIQEQVKGKLAQKYLVQSTQSVKEVAYILGYSDTANFRRAFKRWNGMSPQEFRQAQDKGTNN